MIRKATSVFRSAIIVGLTLAAVGTAVAWFDSYRVGSPPAYDRWYDFRGLSVAVLGQDLRRLASQNPRPLPGSGVMLKSTGWSMTLRNLRGSLRASLSVCSDAPASWPFRAWGGFSYYAREGLNSVCTLTTPEGNNIRGHPNIHSFTTPLWGPLLFFAAYPIIAFIRGPLRRRRRRKRGQCVSCGYNLTGNTSGVCPECSLKVEGDIAGRGEGA